MVTYKEEIRTIIFTNDVELNDVGEVLKALTDINTSDNKNEKKKRNFKRKPIKFYIESYGGDIYAMWAIIDSILASKTPVYTYCHGTCMSAGLKIFLAGEKRFASKHATFMFHSLIGWNCGKIQDLRENQKQYERLQDMINEYVSDRTKYSKKKLEEIVKNKTDLYLDIEEAKTQGVVTDVL